MRPNSASTNILVTSLSCLFAASWQFPTVPNLNERSMNDTHALKNVTHQHSRKCTILRGFKLLQVFLLVEFFSQVQMDLFYHLEFNMKGVSKNIWILTFRFNLLSITSPTMTVKIMNNTPIPNGAAAIYRNLPSNISTSTT